MGDDFDAERKAAAIFNGIKTASLGTLAVGGAPFVSLVTVAPCAGDVVLLLSGLAKHTVNLVHDDRCSLLVVEPGGEGVDPLAGARLTLSGRAEQLKRDEHETERSTFLNRHPSASMYVDFDDFAFYRVEVESAHLVAGFGRIVKLPPDVFEG